MRRYFSFQWHITDDCDQRCKHCYIFSEDRGRRIDSVSWEGMRKILANCLDFCETYGREPYFYITGGDPILHPHFWRLLGLLRRREIPFAILGNPFHLDDAVCARLRGLGCDKYQLSLDGMKETHDWFRKPGSFDCTLEKIACVNRAGICSVIMTTVSGRNAAEVPDLIDVAVAHGAGVYAFARYCPSGAEGNGLTPEGYRALLAVCDAKFKRYEAEGCGTWFDRKDHLWTLYRYETGEFTLPADARPGMLYGGCNCGNAHLTLLPSGELYACRRVRGSRVGNAFEDRIADVWTGEMERYRDYGRFRKCSRCELLAWCRGCPAVARGTEGNTEAEAAFYAPDPQCWKEI